MESCPKENITDFKDQLVEENLYLITEAGEQGRVPVLILTMKEGAQQRRPAIVFLHCSYKCKEWLRPLLEAYTSRGYIAVTIDSRYHGERASNETTYIEARIYLGKTTIDKEVVEKVWDGIAPGLASQFDSPFTVPAIALRPEPILTGARDRRCPLACLDTLVSRALEAY